MRFFYTTYVIITALVLCLTTTETLAQSTPKYSNEFLSIGVGARAFGMSNTVVASADDVTAGFWNPAGLVNQEDKLQISVMHSNYLNGLANYDYVALGTKIKENAALSFAMVRFGVDGIPNTLDLIRNGQINYDRVKEFSAVDYGFFVSYAQKSSIDGLSFGGSAKVVHRRAGEFTTAWGFGIDASARYQTDNNWSFAVIGRDITTTFNAWQFNFTEAEEAVFRSTNNEVPINSLELTLPKVILGAAKKIDFTQDFSLLTEINVYLNTDGRRNTLLKTDIISGDPHMGIEASYKDIIYLRGGAGNFQQEKDLNYEQQWTFMPNIGLGLKLNNLMIDYALSDIGDQSTANYSHVFSIRAAVNPK
ncbi:PorV/PorQ family protein [Bacteroidia bacterium]|nr:PorV/PorQ family protein [Bacteroidia bacterium]